jgi:hypothetical protein
MAGWDGLLRDQMSLYRDLVVVILTMERSGNS